MTSGQRYIVRNTLLSGAGLFLALWLGGAARLNLPASLGLIVLLFWIVPSIIIPDALPASWRRHVRDPRRLVLFAIVYCTIVVAIAHAMTGRWVWREPDGVSVQEESVSAK